MSRVRPAGGGRPPAPRFHGYRVPSARLRAFDYGDGVFFVTVMTAGRVPWLGRLARGGVDLSPAGRVVVEEWVRTGDLRPGVALDAFVVMPDHVHGVLWIDGDGRTAATHGAAENARDTGVETPRRGVSTGHGAPDVRPWRPGVLGAVVGRFKAACTRRIRAVHPDFVWQARFWDVVIRDARHLEAARRYIAANPARAAGGGRQP